MMHFFFTICAKKVCDVLTLPLFPAVYIVPFCRHQVDIYEGRQWVGGKVASFVDKDGNHIEVSICLRHKALEHLFLLTIGCHSKTVLYLCQ